MHEWMTGPEMALHVESGVVRYAHYKEAKVFHHAHAKNMAHRIASGDIVCNLDADNFTGPQFAAFIAHLYAEEANQIMNPALRGEVRVKEELGHFGKIVLPLQRFMDIGGYNERYTTYGGEDSDLLYRGIASGLHFTRFIDPEFRRTIPHSNYDRVVNTREGANIDAAVARIIAKEKAPRLIGRLNDLFSFSAQPLQANRGQHFGMGEVFTGLQGDSLVLGPADVRRRSRADLAGIRMANVIHERVHQRLISVHGPIGDEQTLTV